MLTGEYEPEYSLQQFVAAQQSDKDKNHINIPWKIIQGNTNPGVDFFKEKKGTMICNATVHSRNEDITNSTRFGQVISIQLKVIKNECSYELCCLSSVLSSVDKDSWIL